MIPPVFVIVCGEGLVAFLLMVKIGPLRELVMKGLDEVKMRRGTVSTIAGTIFVILLSCLFSVVGSKHGAMAPMDQVIWRTNLLEATVMGKGHCRFGHGFLFTILESRMLMSFCFCLS